MKWQMLDFRNFYLDLHLSRECVCGLLGKNKSTIYRWEKEQKAPICAINTLLSVKFSTRHLPGWDGWRVVEYGLISPLGHYYSLVEIEPPFTVVKKQLTRRPAASVYRLESN